MSEWRFYDNEIVVSEEAPERATPPAALPSLDADPEWVTNELQRLNDIVPFAAQEPEPAESVVGMLAEVVTDRINDTPQFQHDRPTAKWLANWVLSDPTLQARLAVAPDVPSLDAAWKAAEAALPEGWTLFLSRYPNGTYVAHTESNLTDERLHRHSDDCPTPQAALLALADKLAEPKPASPAVEGGE